MSLTGTACFHIFLYHRRKNSREEKEETTTAHLVWRLGVPPVHFILFNDIAQYDAP